MSGIVGSKLNIRGSGLVGSLGTDGQHLLSAGAGKTNVFESAAAGGAWTKIETQTADCDATLDFETFSTDYRDFRLYGSGIESSYDQAEFGFLIKADGAFQTGDIHQWAHTGYHSDGSLAYGVSVNDHAGMYINSVGTGNASTESLFFDVILADVHDTTLYKLYSSRTVNLNGSTLLHPQAGGGQVKTTSALEGIRCQYVHASRDIESGTVTLYGRAN